MPKIKKLDEKSLIHFNLQKLEAKVDEMQSYLEMNPILSTVTNKGEVEITLDAQDKLHKEILIQIKIQDALFVWLPLLAKLREKEEDAKTIRGDVEVGGMFKNS